jgi:hypothetical protein
VTSVFLYTPGSPLSLAELSAARIDGHVVEVGDAFMPADAIETPALRAASVADLTPFGCAVTHLTAAWIHGAIAFPPVRISVQRTQPGRRRIDPTHRLEYSDSLVEADDLMVFGDVIVTAPTRTLVDLARRDDRGSRTAARAMVAAGLADPDAARRWLWTHSSLPHTGAALRRLGRIRTT